MATKDFKIRHSLTVAENATIEGNLTLGGNTVSRLIDSDYVTTTINSNANEVEVFTVTLDSDVGSIGSPSMGDVAFVPYRNVSGRGVQDTSVTITGGVLYANGLYQFAGNAINKGDLEVGDVMIARTNTATGDQAWVVYSLGNNADEILVAALDSEQILEVWVNDLRTNHTTVPITPSVSGANDPMLTDPAPKFYSGWTSVSNVPGSNPAVTTGVTLSGSAGGITHFMPKAYIHDSDGFDIELIVEGTDAYPEHKVMRRQDVFDSDQIVAIINENTNAGSIDSDVAAVAALRRDADSDSIRIQEIATELEGINQVVDSDLKAIADLRNDLDSESLEIRALRKDIDSDAQILNDLLHEDSDITVDIHAGLIGSTNFRARNDSGSTLFKGTVVYIKGIQGNNPTVDKALASDANRMPAFGIVRDGAAVDEDVVITTSGILTGVDTANGFSEGDTLYVSADSEGGLVTTPPTGITDKIQNIGFVTRSHQDSGSVFVGGAGRSNAVDNHTKLAIDSDNAKLQDHSTRIVSLESRADSDETALQVLDTKISALESGLDSETARIQLLLLSTDSDALSLGALRRDADSDAATIVILKQNAESDSLAIQALSSSLEPRLDSDEQAIQAIKTDMDVSFNIVNNGASAYTFSGDGFPSGVDNPTLYLNRGQTYNFRVNASGHPFEIRLSNGGSAYSSGVTNNAAQIGEVKFVVPMDAPETLVYQCTIHSGMVGTIKIGKQGFDSDQIASMILENAGPGMTDSDLAVVAKLRNDVDSDSIKLQALEETVAGLSSGMTDSDLKVVADLRNDVDSDSIKLQALQETVAGLSGGGGSGMTDSDLKVVADLRNDLDSELRASRTTLSITRFDYTATQGQTSFSGADDNGNTLSYVSSKIQVFLNGILLLDNTDYTANNDTSLTLTVAADSDDKISIIKYLGVAAEEINITRFTYKYNVDGNGIVGDSDITGNDEYGNTLSYTAGKIQVYSNGILLEDSDDYIATDGSTITLRAAPDSDDVVSIFKYLGTIQSGFDSEQVVSIVNENSSGVTTGKAIAMAIVFGG